MTVKYSVFQRIPAGAYDDTQVRDILLQNMAEQITRDVTAHGYDVTSEVTFNGPMWSALYEDENGEPQWTPLETRDEIDVSRVPCPYCHVGPRKRCLTRSYRVASHYHKHRYPAVFADYTARADTSRND